MNTGSTLAGRPSLGSWVTLRTRERECESAGIRGDERYAPGLPWPAGRGTGERASCRQSIRERSSTVALSQSPTCERQPRSGQRDSRASLITWASSIAVIFFRGPDQSELDARIQSYELAFRMQAEAPEAVDLARETVATQLLYGLDNPATDRIGRLCLLAGGWSSAECGSSKSTAAPAANGMHTAGIEANHAQTCGAMDRPVAGLLKDLKSRGLLEETLVVWGGEFGRTPMSEKGDGRDHNPYGFTMWMAGGGVKQGNVVGKTDEVGLHAIEDRLHVHDIHATILHALGVDHSRLVFRHQGRPERPTVNEGRVFRGLFKV